MAGRLRILTEAWLILVLAAVFGASLAAVHTSLSGRIEANKRAETLRQVPALVLGADATAASEISIVGDRIELAGGPTGTMALQVVEREIGGHQVLAAHDAATDELLGWVVYGADQGYADLIELLVGVSADGESITGLFVLSQKETPALGDGITKSDFRDRFIGRPTAAPLQVSRAADGSGIQAITAATISSRAVCDIVNRAVRDVKPLLGQEGGAR